MSFKDIMFGDFAPDRGGLPVPSDPGYLVQANNVRPTSAGYRPVAVDEVVASAATLPASPNCAAGVQIFAGAARHYVTTDDDIYESDDSGATWNVNSRAGGYSSSSNWEFAFFNQYVIAVNDIDEPQYKEIVATATTDFADLAGSPPIAGTVARIRDHIFLGRLSDDQYAIQWNAIGDPETWPTPGSAQALATQSNRKTLPYNYGPVWQIVGGERAGLIFQTGGIHRATYVGGNVGYEIDDLETPYGTGFRRSAIMVGGWCYYASSMGFFRTDGFEVQPLSKGRLDDAIFRDFLSLAEAAGSPGVGVAFDPVVGAVMWSSAAAYMLCYHIDYGRFATLERATTADTFGLLYTLNDLASAFESVGLVYGWNSSNRLVSFTDQSNVACSLRTGYFPLIDGVAQINGLELLGKGSSDSVPSIELKSVMNLTAADLAATGYTAASVPGRSHLYRIRQSGRYHSLKLTETADAECLYQGVRVHYDRASGL